MSAPTEPPPFPSPVDPPPMLPPAGVLRLDAAAVQWVRDDENLRMLSISHYAFGGMVTFIASIFLIYVAFGIFIVNWPRAFSSTVTTSSSVSVAPVPGSVDQPSPTPVRTHDPIRHRASGGDAPPAFVGYVMIGIGSAAVLLGGTMGGLIIYSGRCLARRRRRVFTMVIGGVSCLSVPFGTLLGIFTLIVLGRPSVRALYAAARVGPSPPAPAHP